jgi:hypothetical protein
VGQFQLPKATGDEKTRELIDSISDKAKRDDEIAKFLKVLGAARSKCP